MDERLASLESQYLKDSVDNGKTWRLIPEDIRKMIIVDLKCRPWEHVDKNDNVYAFRISDAENKKHGYVFFTKIRNDMLEIHMLPTPTNNSPHMKWYKENFVKNLLSDYSLNISMHSKPDGSNNCIQIKAVGWSILRTILPKLINWSKENQEKISGNFDLQNEINIEEIKMSKTNELANLLRHTHNLILHGAPGTGKTHLAKEIAKEIGAEWEMVQFHPSYDYTDFVEGLRPVNAADGNSIGFERKDGVFKTFCARALKSFLDSKKSVETLNEEKNLENEIKSSADDVDSLISRFKEELRATGSIEIKSIRSDIKLSVFMKDDSICVMNSKGNPYLTSPEKIRRYIQTETYDEKHSTYEPAIGQYILDNYSNRKFGANNFETGESSSKKIEDKSFIFIIDEINRGEISKIFGELFFSIDPGYRGEKGKISTQYQNLIEAGDAFADGFFIPENVYIIGTMNDIDRSVESMDFAFRRRFAFFEIKANENLGMLDELDDSIREEAKARLLNLNEAISKIEGLSTAYHIGGAYFLKLKELENDFDSLWNYHLEGLLREYLRGMEDAENLLALLKSAYENHGSDSESAERN